MTDTERLDQMEAWLRAAAKFDNDPRCGLTLEPAGNLFVVIVNGPDDMLVAPTLREAIDLALATVA
jgi:hypothetical protein